MKKKIFIITGMILCILAGIVIVPSVIRTRQAVKEFEKDFHASANSGADSAGIDSEDEPAAENEEVSEEEEKKGNHVVKTEDGYRRIVAAPNPMQIVELDAVNALMDADQVVIAAGGGGIPVLEQGTTLKGASAVIEKDLIAGLLADGVEADMLIILTGEECVYKNYGTDKQEPIREMTCAQAQKYMAEREFGEGTMQPKIETALSYIGDYATRQVLITKLGNIEAAMAGQTGTIIKK